MKMECNSDLRYNFWQITGWDKCSECHSNTAQNVCQHCGDIICLHDDCSINFPYKNNQIYSICSTCKESISKKFKIVETEDYPELRLLKKKIKKRLQIKIKQYE
jgi:hypothetical protein